MLIGLTGKTCAGKNYIASLLEERGLPVIDVDKLGYQVLEAEKEAIFVRFGRDLQKTDGSLDRRLLGQRVFGKPKELAALEAIVHPPVNRLVDEWIATITESQKNCVINAALLHKAAAFNRLDCIILVTAPLFTRLLRAKRRDKLSWAAIFKRFASQKDFNSKYLSINAEIYRVENPGLTGKPEDRIDKILEGIL
jgi:dephospho-CoA kinase